MPPTRKSNHRQLSQSPDIKPQRKQRKSCRLVLKSLPSFQSSVDVPIVAKTAVKLLQDNGCWLCGRKAHKTCRRLEIAHIFPRAISKRIQFETHHKRGRLEKSNIDNTANMIGLCSVCHYAFDLEEWTFLPDDISAWIQATNAEPEKNFIPIWNSQRDNKFRPWRLAVDPHSQASQDKDFNSAFTNNLPKTCSGEVGALILSRSYLYSIDVGNPSTGLVEVLEEYRKLHSLWMNGDSSDEDGEGGDNDNAKSNDDQEEDQNQENKENEGGGYLEEDDEGDNGDMGYDSYEEDDEDGEYEEDDEHEEDGHYQEDEVVEGRGGNHQKKASLYDTSVPYSYRKGYTWAGLLQTN